MSYVDTSNPHVTVVWEPEEWTRGERMQLLRLLFGPRMAEEPKATDAGSVVASRENRATSPAADQATGLV